MLKTVMFFGEIFFMKNTLFFCVLMMPIFLGAMQAETVAVIKSAVKKDKSEHYLKVVSFAEAFRSRSFDHLGKAKVTFEDINKSKIHEISYWEANEILYKFAKKTATMVKNKKTLDKEFDVWLEQKLPFNQTIPRQKYLLELVAMDAFYEPSHPGYNQIAAEIQVNRILYLTAWGTGDSKKIKKALNFCLYNEKEKFLCLADMFENIIK